MELGTSGEKMSVERKFGAVPVPTKLEMEMGLFFRQIQNEIHPNPEILKCPKMKEIWIQNHAQIIIPYPGNTFLGPGIPKFVGKLFIKITVGVWHLVDEVQSLEFELNVCLELSSVCLCVGRVWGQTCKWEIEEKVVGAGNCVCKYGGQERKISLHLSFRWYLRRRWVTMRQEKASSKAAGMASCHACFECWCARIRKLRMCRFVRS